MIQKKQNIKIEIKEKENKKNLKPAPVAGRKERNGIIQLLIGKIH